MEVSKRAPYDWGFGMITVRRNNVLFLAREQDGARPAGSKMRHTPKGRKPAPTQAWASATTRQ
jgi:hypothetical protein